VNPSFLTPGVGWPKPPIDGDNPEETIISHPMSQDMSRAIRRRIHPSACHKVCALVLVLAAFLVCPLHSPAQELARRLILKDGSYQLVTKYEVKGDRVRYLSAERDDWEELPTALIDWPATDKFERDRAAGSAVPEAAQLDKEIEEENNRAEALLPEVAPGLRLPENSGVFLLDSFQGEPQVVEVQQTAGDVAPNSKTNVFRGALDPTGLKLAIELDGPHAPVQVHVDVPSLYINLADDPNQPDINQAIKDSSRTPQDPQQAQQPSLPSDRFRIVHADIKKDKRIVGAVKRQPTGKISQEQHLVKTTSTRVGSGWIKLTPTEPLPPGEYALVEMTDQKDAIDKQGMNLYVWDFGVNPKAPANANPWKPTPTEEKPAPAAKPN